MANERKFIYTFEERDVGRWEYCPLCGSELLEVYPGDYFGHLTCGSEEGYCDDDISFKITTKEAR